MIARRAARRRARSLDAQLPVLASTLARSAHSGATLVQAIEEAASSLPEPAGVAAADVAASVARGVPVEEALQDWAGREQLDGVRLLVTAAQVGYRHGGDLTVALDAAAVSLLDRAEVADEARALSTQARTSAGVLVALPPFGAACFCLLDPAVAATLFTTPVGWLCVLIGTALDTAGAVVMHRLVLGALR
jgi:tight adherence protein B